MNERTEVDFAEDLRRAQSEIFPAIAKLEGT
jgi:choline kinase